MSRMLSCHIITSFCHVILPCQLNCHVILLRHTFMLHFYYIYNSVILSYHITMPYYHDILSQRSTMLYSNGINTNMSYYHSYYHIILPYYTLKVYILTCHIIMSYYHVILSCHTIMSYYHIILPCYNLMVYILTCHTIMSYYHIILPCYTLIKYRY